MVQSGNVLPNLRNRDLAYDDAGERRTVLSDPRRGPVLSDPRFSRPTLSDPRGVRARRSPPVVVVCAGWAHLGTGDVDRAMRMGLGVLKQDASHLEAYRLCSKALYLKGDFDQVSVVSFLCSGCTGQEPHPTHPPELSEFLHFAEQRAL